MVRDGEFKIYAYGNNHCGVDRNLKIKYHMVCLCSPKLDRRGFLFDQLNVQNYFDSIKRSRLSCEKLVKQSCKQLLDRILVENPQCQIYKMELTLSPAPHMASMTYTWNNPSSRFFDQ